MDIDSSDQSDVQFAGKIKTQTFKQHQQELLIKAKVMPASKLAETAKRNAEQLRAFEAAAEDEQRHKRTATPAPSDKLNNLPLTREPFEE
ncbi:hypothetical protein [Polynucleobacter paneuropaeus]|jgi:hypothetical protein|uniref:hypothetical protein n=1 Tax=Polynucleobacter paneuropaeus TaxID=2527775 RepID=UPI001BFE8B4A|nr:hypothetical protein [Polynucleobacter paneuropaeus]MBT8622543.1 hypothetical protein [Polynucleobacter paneuropaeus]